MQEGNDCKQAVIHVLDTAPLATKEKNVVAYRILKGKDEFIILFDRLNLYALFRNNYLGYYTFLQWKPIS